MKKNCKKTNQTEFRVEKVLKKIDNKLYVNWKGYVYSFNSWTDRKILIYKMRYFHEPYSHSKK